MTSELEAKLADYLYDDLLERYMTDKVFLMVACCLSMFDNPNTKFEEIKGANVKPESIKDIIVTFDVTFDESEPFLPIGKGGFTTYIAPYFILEKLDFKTQVKLLAANQKSARC